MSVWSLATHERNEQCGYAALAVHAIQSGKDPHWYMERAAQHRATMHEFLATGDIISPLLDERIAARRNRDARKT